MGGHLQSGFTECLPCAKCRAVPWGEDGKSGTALTVQLARQSGRKVVECGVRDEEGH